MHTFTDGKGKEWTLNLSLAAAERIDQCDFSLLTDNKSSFLEPDEERLRLLAQDTAVIFAHIWCIILPEAQQEGIDQDEFKERITPTVIPEAKEAFWGEVRDFFPELGIALSKMLATREKALAKMSEAMDRAEQRVDAAMDKKIKEEMDNLVQELESGEISTP